MDRFDCFNIEVFDAFIDKFAAKYVAQRSHINEEVLENAEKLNCGLDTKELFRIIRANSTYVDPAREDGHTPTILRDIYRSDLGEILTTYYFEERLPEEERFIIPLKNISTRERYDMPGRGFDALGYRIDKDGVINLLISEAKVSASLASPPEVVDVSPDSIYKNQRRHHDDQPMVLQRLTEYLRHVSNSNHVVALACLVLYMDKAEINKYRITYGCGLVRDYACLNTEKDYGKMKANVEEFRPGNVHFEIFSFTNKTIEETVNLFYNKVRDLTK